MILAKDLMNIGTPTLSFDSSVEDAIHYLRTHPTAFVAVCASEDRFHGVLTEGNMMRVYLRYQNQKEKEALIFYRDCFDPLQLIHEEEGFSEVVKKTMTAVGNRVFVIDDAGNVCGHITAKDILPYFTEKVGVKSADKKLDISEELLMTIEALKSDLYLYENFFTKSPFMMHSVGQDGKIQMANEVLHAALGYQYGELIGKTIFDLYPKENHKKAEQGIKQIFDKGFHKVVQGQMVTKAGIQVEVELMSRALTDQNSKPIGTITISRPMDMAFLLKSLPHT